MQNTGKRPKTFVRIAVEGARIWVGFDGPRGCGKTHNRKILAKAIRDEFGGLIISESGSDIGSQLRDAPDVLEAFVLRTGAIDEIKKLIDGNPNLHLLPAQSSQDRD